jgi:hypothetical protein
MVRQASHSTCLKCRWSERHARRGPSPTRRSSRPSKPSLRVRGASAFAFRRSGPGRRPSPLLLRALVDGANNSFALPDPELIPGRRAGIHPLGYLCAATLRCGIVVAPK